ncbi:hypothetical protein KIN20_017400, partial [Parelaphostrongylus tenuis]
MCAQPTAPVNDWWLLTWAILFAFRAASKSGNSIVILQRHHRSLQLLMLLYVIGSVVTGQLL